MTKPAKGWLLDTGILVHVLRGSPLGRHLVETEQLRARPEVPQISVVTVGELMALGRKKNWGSGKTERMRELLGELIVVDINSQPVLDAYAELDAWSEPNGKTLGKNDLWIAATAVATDSILLTTDRDFDALEGTLLQRTYYDPKGDYARAASP